MGPLYLKCAGCQYVEVSCWRTGNTLLLGPSSTDLFDDATSYFYFSLLSPVGATCLTRESIFQHPQCTQLASILV